MKTASTSKTSTLFRRLRKNSRLSLAAAVASVLASHGAQATQYFWDGSGNGGGAGLSWDAANSWTTNSGVVDVGSAVPTSLDLVTFRGTIAGPGTAQTANLNGSQSILGITTLNQTTPTTILGGTGDQILTIGTSGISHVAGGLVIGSVTSGQKVSIKLAGTQTWVGSASGVTPSGMAILNDVSLLNAGAQTLTLDGSNISTKIDGNISDGAGSLALIRSGNSTSVWTLNGSVNITGGVTMTAGTLNITNNTVTNFGAIALDGGTFGTAGLGATDSIFFNGGTFRVNGTTLTTFAAGNNVTFGSGKTVTVLLATADEVFTFNRLLDSTNSLTKSGVGTTMVLTGAQTYTGATTITTGSLSVDSINSVVGGTATSNLGAPVTVANGTIKLGAGTNAGFLIFTGTTETTDRVINLAGTTGGGVLQADNASGLLKFTSDLTAVTGGAKTLFLRGSGNAEFAGNIINDASVGVTVSKDVGAGTWTLSGTNNTYTGGTTLALGTLNVKNTTSIGTGALNVSGGTIDNTSAGPVTLTPSSVAISGDFAFGGTNNLTLGTGDATTGANVTRTLTLGGTSKTLGLGRLLGSNSSTSNTSNVAVTVNAAGGSKLTLTGAAIANHATAEHTLTFNGTGNIDVTGAITDGTGSQVDGKLIYAGSGTLKLSGTNTYRGATSVNLGTLALSGGSLAGTAVTVASGAAPVANVSGHATLNVQGNYTMGTAAAGTLAIRGGNGTTVGQGTLSLLDTTLNTLTLGRTSAGTNLTLAGTAGNSSIIRLDAGSAGTDLIAVGTNLVLNAGGAVINFNQLAGTTLAAGTYDLFTFAAGSTFTGAFTLGTTPTATATPGFVTVFSLGLDNANPALATKEQLFLSSAAIGATAYWTGSENTVWNTITPITNATNFTLNDGSGGFVLPGSGSDVFFTATSAGNLATTLGQSFTINSLTFTGAGTSATAPVTIGGASPLTLQAGITVATGSGDHTISAPIALSADQSWTVTDAATTLTASGGISGAFNLTKAGAGTLVLTGANGSVATTISAGTLQIGNATAAGSLGSGLVTNNATLAFNTAGGAIAVSSQITGGGAITKTGANTLTLSGPNDYTGTTAVTGGKLILGSNTGLGTNANGTTFASGTGLQLQGNITSNEGLAFTNNSDTIILQNVSGNNELTANMTIAYSNNTRFDSALGNLKVSGNVALTASGGLFVLQGAGSGEISGNLSGVGAQVFKSASNGAGTWILSGTNTYSSLTTSGLGSLQLGNGGTSGSIGNSSGLVLGSAGGFAVNRSDTVTQGTELLNSTGVISGAGTFTQAGTGTTVLNKANTYTGATTLSAGTLIAANAAALGTSAAGTTIASGATLDVQANIGTEAISVAGNGVGGNGALVTGTGTGTVGGAVTLTADAKVGGAAALTIAGDIGGAFKVTKVGAGTTTLSGVQNYTTLATNEGVTNVSGAFTGGTVNANATTNFTVSQTLAALNIGTVPLAGLGAAPAFIGGGATVVPEPGSAVSLLGGLTMLLGLQRFRRRA